MAEENRDAGASTPWERRVPDGDSRERLVCTDCGFVNYENPKIVVGVVATWGERILLCRRAIQPRRGFWTLPAGYLELNETTADGAAREAREEACAEIRLGQLLAVYSIPRISQVQLMYRADLVSPDVAAGEETEAVGLFGWDEIPWETIAFPSVRWALHHHRETRHEPAFVPRSNPPGETGDMRR
ncbi:MAG: NUDIX domain-containing protein [Alphaproteobacteria bacterium]